MAVENGAYGSLALAEALRAGDIGDPRDRGLVTELVYGVLRWRRRVDAVLVPHVKQGFEKLEPVARELLRIGAYQILFLDRIPPPIAVSATQDAARNLGAGRLTGLLNGVLRRVAENGETLPEGQGDADIAYRASLPRWVVTALRVAYGDEGLEAEAMALRDRAQTSVRPTLGRGGAEAAQAGLEAADFTVEPGPHGTLTITGPGDPYGTTAFYSGLYMPQDPGSLAVVEDMDLAPGDRVLDLCAGRGVKATAMADRGATVLACDRSAPKLADAVKLAKRLGVDGKITTRVIDATDPPPDLGLFPHVLVDAPCTGLGTLRRHPEITWRRQAADLASMVEVQEAMLRAAARHVAPGGLLTFAVCSFHRSEMPKVELEGFITEELGPPKRPTEGSDIFQVGRWRRGSEIP
jgi:16S rRNA (cytosine967-C5)-methyltransferase